MNGAVNKFADTASASQHLASILGDFHAETHQPRRADHADPHLTIMCKFNSLIQSRLQDGVTVLNGDCFYPPLSLNFHFRCPGGDH